MIYARVPHLFDWEYSHMKKSFLCAGAATLLLSGVTFAGQKTLYGKDGREDISDFVGSMLRNKAKSVAGMVAKDKLEAVEGGYTFQAQNLTNFGMCSSVNFSSQNLLPDCTGFLVGEDLLMTAGHCIESYQDCQNNTWIFNYDKKAAENQFIAEGDRLDCKRVVKREYDPDNGVDYAIIQLQQRQSLKNHPPLPLTSRTFRVGDNVAMIGHPASLPLKITTGGVAVSGGENTLLVSLDAFGGNSGSPVFDRQTGELLGMLTGGGTDFIEENGCKVEYKCPMVAPGKDVCGGEDVFKVSRADIPSLLASWRQDSTILESVVEGDFDLVKYFIGQGEDLNQTVFGWSPLLQAVYLGNNEMVQYLIDQGADLQAVDQFDNSSALILAVQTGNEELADLLIEAGVDLDVQTSQMNETALTLAIQKEMLELSERLINAGARTDLQTKDGHTAKDFADYIGSYELLELIGE